MSGSGGTEIERTWLVTGDQWREATREDPTELAQGYLHVDEDASIRVRLRGQDEAVLTVKRGGRGRARSEVEVPMGREEAERLVDEATVGEVIRKHRHRVDLPAAEGAPRLTAEVDEFVDQLEGLVLVEVELPDRDTAVPEVAWFGQEVTEDERYYNARLALDGLPAAP